MYTPIMAYSLQIADSAVIDVVFAYNKAANSAINRQKVRIYCTICDSNLSSHASGDINIKLLFTIVVLLYVYSLSTLFSVVFISECRQFTANNDSFETYGSYASATTTKSSQFQTSLRYVNSSAISPLASILIIISIVYSTVKTILQLKA